MRFYLHDSDPTCRNYLVCIRSIINNFGTIRSQEGDGIGGIGGQAQLFTSTKSAEKTLNRVTWPLSITFIALTIVLSAGWLG